MILASYNFVYYLDVSQYSTDIAIADIRKPDCVKNVFTKPHEQTYNKLCVWDPLDCLGIVTLEIIFDK